MSFKDTQQLKSLTAKTGRQRVYDDWTHTGTSKCLKMSLEGVQ